MKTLQMIQCEPCRALQANEVCDCKPSRQVRELHNLLQAAYMHMVESMQDDAASRSTISVDALCTQLCIREFNVCSRN
jgi:hypothetical protein